jgi:hypothetical protein
MSDQRLWHEADVEVKKVKAPHSQTAFGSCDVQKLHAAVTRSTFRSSSVQVGMLKKCTPFRREAHLRSQNVKNTPRSDHFWTFNHLFLWQAKWLLHLHKLS